MTENKIIHAFPPVIGDRPRILILGTMPGPRSLEMTQYYGHPRNQFWRFMGDIVGASPIIPYEKRLDILKQNHIAVWDVFQSCVRKNALDSEIKHETVNNFAAFFAEYPTIKYVIFDSGTAEKAYLRKVLPTLPPDLDLAYQRVPSPSPAYAGMKYEDKLSLWREAFNHCQIQTASLE